MVYGGEWTVSGFDTADGFYVDVFLTFTNNTGISINQNMLWTIQAKEDASSWTGPDTWVAMRHKATAASSSTVEWVSTNLTWDGDNPMLDDLSFITDPINFVGAGYSNLFEKTIVVPSGTSTINIVDGTNADYDHNKIIDSDPMFTNDWDFRIIAITHPGDGNVYQDRGHGAAWDDVNQWPMCPWESPYTGGGWPQTGFSGDIYYMNQNSNQYPTLLGLVAGGSIGTVGQSTNVVLATNDSYVYDIKDTLWGDVEVNDSPGSVQVYDGTNLVWMYTDFTGLWGSDTLAGTDSMTELLCKVTLYMQNKPTYKANYTIATSSVDSDYNSDADMPRLINPINVIKDKLYYNKLFVPLSLEMLTVKDEVKGKFFEMLYSSDGAVVVTNGELPDEPDDPVGEA